jgi:hypothetical protein
MVLFDVVSSFDAALVVEGALEEQQPGQALPGDGAAGGEADAAVAALKEAGIDHFLQVFASVCVQVGVQEAVDLLHAAAGAQGAVEGLAGAHGDPVLQVAPGELEGQAREDAFQEEEIGVGALVRADAHVEELCAQGGEERGEEGVLGGSEKIYD